MKKCPLRKIKENVNWCDSLVNKNDNIAAKEVTLFGNCYEDQCMAYKDGVCMMMRWANFNENSNCC